MERPRHWITRVADRVEQRVLRDKGAGATIVCASGVSPSGPIHLGNLREVMTVHLVAEELRDRGWSVDHVHSWDDFDRLRKLPAGVPAEFAEHIGLPISDIPDPDGRAESWAACHIEDFERSAAQLGIAPRWVRQYRAYRGGTCLELVGLAMARRELIFDVLAQFQAPGRHEAPLRSAAARTTPSGLLRELPQGHHGDRELGPGHGRALVPLRQLWPRRGVQPARQGRGEAGLEGRLADALGLRGRDLRALRCRPLLARARRFVVGGQIVREIFGGSAADRPDVRLRRHQRHGQDVVVARAGCRPRRDALKIMEAPLLRWLYARRRPEPVLQDRLRPGDPAALRRVGQPGRQGRRRPALPATPPRTPRAARTAAGELPRTPRPLPYRTLASVVDITAGHDEQTLRILRELDPANPVTLAGRDPAAARPGRDLDQHPGPGRAAHPSSATSPTRELLGLLDERARESLRLLLDGLDEHWSLDGLTHLVYGVPKIQPGWRRTPSRRRS